MPGAVFVPAQLNDLSVDVALGTPAQGAVMYRGASKWNALAAGTNGQVLTSGGASANPSWTTISSSLAGLSDVSFTSVARGNVIYRGASAWNNLAPGTAGQSLLSGGAGADPSWGTPTADLSPAVILAPAASTRNVIQPTGDAVKGLIVKGFSGTHSANFYEAQTSAADTVFSVSPGRVLQIGGTYPNTGSLYVRCFHSASIALVLDDIGNGYQATIRPYLGNSVLFATGITGNTPAQLICAGLTSANDPSNTRFSSGTYTTTIDVSALDTTTIAGNVFDRVSSAGTPGAGFGNSFALRLKSTTTNSRDAGSIQWLWVTATDATRKARVVHNVYDTAVREALRFEASGTAAMVGFFGAAAVVQQANASQAAITAVADANAKSALQAIYNLLTNYGLAPATA